MNNKFPYIFGGIVLFALIAVVFMNPQGNRAPKRVTGTASIIPTASPTQPNSTQDPQDIVPGLYKNPIQNTATKEGFSITAATVENNVDQTGKTIGDHLELTLKNIAGADLTNFEVYYTITDSVTNKKEGYYKKLAGFVLQKGTTASINFDNKQGAGHFTANTNSIYYTSANKLHFDVLVSTPGYKMQTIQVDKAAGGAETKD